MAINRINETDLQNKLVSQLSNRPTDPHSAGGDNMTAQQVKARHDALGLLVKDKLNELLDALNNATVNGEPVTPLSDLITVVADGVSKSLTEWIEAKLTKSTTAGEGEHAYGVDDDGDQEMLPVSASATAGAIPKYGTGGVLPVADGTADGHAVAKGQMATAITEAINALSTTLTSLISAKYTKPDGGIPADDLASAVKAILESAVSQSEFAPVKALAENADKVLTAANYEAVATMLNAAAKTDYKVGQKILIGAGRVPDLWIYFVHESAVSYTYTTALAFQTALENGTLQIGYYALRPLEAKTDLEGYATETYVGNAISGNIDATLSTTGKSADAKAVGDAIDALIGALVDGVMSVAEATYAESATYAQQADIANQINTDREIEDADTACPPVVFGTVGGAAEVQNGLMKFPELRGHTIKWNQLIQNGNFESSTGWQGFNSYVSVSDGVATVTASSGHEGNFGLRQQRDLPIPTGHKVLALCSAQLVEGSNFVLRLRYPATSQETRLTTYFQRLAFFGTTDGTEASNFVLQTIYGSGETCTIQIKNVQLFDLTDIYGAGKEPTTVAEFVRDYPKPYYPYNAGTLLSSKSSSVDFVKRNQWDEEWEVGGIDDSTGAKVDVQQQFRSKNYIPVLPNTDYFFVAGTTLYSGGYVYFYDANKSFVGRAYTTQYDVRNQVIKTPLNCVYVLFKVQMTSGTGDYKNDICIYINWDTPGLPYVPNSKQHIVLPNLELRSAGSAYDVLYQQGGGKRRVGTVDLGTLTWYKDSSYNYFYARLSAKKPDGGGVANGTFSRFYTMTETWGGDIPTNLAARIAGGNTELRIRNDAYTDAETFTTAMDGVTLYYELATETDITVEENPGWDEYADIDNFGTVKFNQDPAQDIPVPQAYFVRYTVNLVEFLDSVGERAGFDASKIALLEDIVVPDAPTTDGSYTLKVTVSSGTPTYTWVADE